MLSFVQSNSLIERLLWRNIPTCASSLIIFRFWMKISVREINTFCDHPHCKTFLKPTELTFGPWLLVYGTAFISNTLIFVQQLFLYCPLKETLAAFTSVRTVMVTGGTITAYSTPLLAFVVVFISHSTTRFYYLFGAISGLLEGSHICPQPKDKA